uniref:cAMP-responsive element modulator-like n=1 Tax=Jaculus jaculus TaxID=51337 RepID=UPI001E1B2069|nr:cAMP-responsive element modulator-like [Jaculus jaculus]
MTTEEVELQQDGDVIPPAAERSVASHVRQTGQILIPALAQVATTAEASEPAESEGGVDSHKWREILSCRPSYRKILSELSSDVPGILEIEEEKSEREGMPPTIATMAVTTSMYQTSMGQYSMYATIPLIETSFRLP